MEQFLSSFGNSVRTVSDVLPQVEEEILAGKFSKITIMGTVATGTQKGNEPTGLLEQF